MKDVGTAQYMKQVSIIVVSFAALLLAGCSVNPSVLGTNIAGIAGGDAELDKSLVSPIASANSLTGVEQAPALTGSIVPLRAEGAVVDLPDASHLANPQASDQLQASSSMQGTAAQPLIEGEQADTAKERHRRELINRGDLQEGHALPVE